MMAVVRVLLEDAEEGIYRVDTADAYNQLQGLLAIEIHDICLIFCIYTCQGAKMKRHNPAEER